MDDVFVGSLMSSPVHTAQPDSSLQTAANQMLAHGISSVIIVDDEGHLEGILTTTDFIDRFAVGSTDPNTPVAAAMSTEVITTTVHEPIQDIAELMVEEGFHHVPVLDDESVVGVITTIDLAVFLSGKSSVSSPELMDTFSF